jgi:hypothetical protein
VIEGSQGPKLPAGRAGAAGAGVDRATGGPLTGGGSDLVTAVAAVEGAIAAAGACEGVDCRRASKGFWAESLRCFGIGGCGFGIIGHRPLVRTDR